VGLEGVKPQDEALPAIKSCATRNGRLNGVQLFSGKKRGSIEGGFETHFFGQFHLIRPP
jgi:hypothetical protein